MANPVSAKPLAVPSSSAPASSSNPSSQISGLPTAAVGGWTCQVAQGVLHRQHQKDDFEALGTPAYVTCDKRALMDPKDKKRLVKSMLTPFPTDKFVKIDKVSTESLVDIERIH